MNQKTYPRCTVCANADRRRLVELGWNGGMGMEPMARVLEGQTSRTAIEKHIKEHAAGDGNSRRLDPDPELPMRERVYAIQRMQVDEVERRIEMAKTKAEDMNREREKLTDADGKPYPPVDWSDFYDILSPTAQAAIGTILKTQGLVDKREKAVADTKLGLFEAMANAGLAPKALVGGFAPPALSSGEDEDGVVLYAEGEDD